MDFEEEAVNASCHRRTGEERNVLRLAAADPIGSGRLLNGMGAIKDHRREFAHDGERAEVDDQGVVAEACAALREEDTLVAGGAYLFDGVVHIPWSDELALLYVDSAAGFARGYEEVSLAAEKCGDLQNVDGFSRDFAVGGLVDVGEDGQARLPGQAAKYACALCKARATEALDAGAIGFIVAGFEDVGNAQVGGDALDGVCHGAHVGFTFNYAGASYEEKLACADMHGTDFKGVAHEGDFILPEACKASLSSKVGAERF